MEEQQDFKELLELFTLNKRVISRKKITNRFSCTCMQKTLLRFFFIIILFDQLRHSKNYLLDHCACQRHSCGRKQQFTPDQLRQFRRFCTLSVISTIMEPLRGSFFSNLPSIVFYTGKSCSEKSTLEGSDYCRKNEA